ncbi:hypothetical protein K438DRAFT_2016166 [Mycena galopus ATCC 62051]|nr:hypothetical protein K438DRAFT_2016166 [Mycena galopus ATCC 62051]
MEGARDALRAALELTADGDACKHLWRVTEMPRGGELAPPTEGWCLGFLPVVLVCGPGCAGLPVGRRLSYEDVVPKLEWSGRCRGDTRPEKEASRARQAAEDYVAVGMLEMHVRRSAVEMADVSLAARLQREVGVCALSCFQLHALDPTLWGEKSLVGVRDVSTLSADTGTGTASTAACPRPCRSSEHQL